MDQSSNGEISKDEFIAQVAPKAEDAEEVTQDQKQRRMAKLRKFMVLQRLEKRQKILKLQWEFVESALNAVFSNNSDIYSLCALIDDANSPGGTPGCVHVKNFIKHMGRAMRKGPDVMEPLFGVLCQFILQRRRATGQGSGRLKVAEVADSLALRERSEEEARMAQGEGGSQYPDEV